MSLHVRGGHTLEFGYGATLCQNSAKPSNRFRKPPIAAANSTTPEAHRRGREADCGHRPTRVMAYRANLA
jgi:hypothetical protein